MPIHSTCKASDQNTHTQHRVLPKRLAEPINRLMKVVSDLQRGHDSGNALVEELV